MDGEYKNIEIEFLGAEEFFYPDNKAARPSGFSSREEIEARWEEEQAVMRSHSLILERHDFGDGIAQFEGSKMGLIYKASGSPKLAITLFSNPENGMSNGRRYLLDTGMELSPAETMQAMRTNDLVLGLTFITVALAFLSGLSPFLRRFRPLH